MRDPSAFQALGDTATTVFRAIDFWRKALKLKYAVINLVSEAGSMRVSGFPTAKIWLLVTLRSNQDLAARMGAWGIMRLLELTPALPGAVLGGRGAMVPTAGEGAATTGGETDAGPGLSAASVKIGRDPMVSTNGRTKFNKVVLVGKRQFMGAQTNDQFQHYTARAS